MRAWLLPLILLLCLTERAAAHDVVVRETSTPVHVVQACCHGARPHGSILGYGLRGVLTGALVGLGVSYFSARDAWDPGLAVGAVTGIGALGGAAFGLTLGVLDHVELDSAYYISRDLSWGVLFGAVVGAVAGGVVAVNDGDPELILLGAASGSLAGVGLGLITGILEGHYRHHRHDHHDARAQRRVSVGVAQLTTDTRAYGPRLSGSF